MNKNLLKTCNFCTVLFSLVVTNMARTKSFKFPAKANLFINSLLFNIFLLHIFFYGFFMYAGA